MLKLIIGISNNDRDPMMRNSQFNIKYIEKINKNILNIFINKFQILRILIYLIIKLYFNLL